ncbi:putative telomerase reverse transcriptase [[Candida] jaroonii]|uniref:Telomerase reverse transcriptase n=1 Tax=[Candida] jaroonii TaxID=467808 RepID=A0ACA9YE45_9ASCO|nr:putative telomerase reverse transcriptase [[Candida] jaroonii]
MILTLKENSHTYCDVYHLVDTTIVVPQGGDVSRHIKKIPFKHTYPEFIDSIIGYILGEKIPNCLVDGYVDNSLSAGWTNSNFNPTTSFKSTILKLPVWGSLYSIIGKDLFLQLVLSTKVYYKTTNGIYYQLCGREMVATYNNDPPSNYTVISVDLPHDELVREIIDDKKQDHTSGKYESLRHLCSVVQLNYGYLHHDKIYSNVITHPGPLKDLTPVELHQVIKFGLTIHGKLLPRSVMGKNHKVITKIVVNYLKLGEKSIDSTFLRGFCFKSAYYTTTRTKMKQDHSRSHKESMVKFFQWYLRMVIRSIVHVYWKTVKVNVNGKDRLEYYHIKHWKSSSFEWLKKYSDQYLYPVDQEFTNTTNIQNNFVGSIRLVPKTKGFRMICIPMKTRPLSVMDEKEETIRYILHIKKFIRPLQYLINTKDRELVRDKTHHPRSFSNSDIAQHVHDFKQVSKHQPLHFLKFDMKRCYDNINHQKLLESIDNLFARDPEDEVYYLRQIREGPMYSDRKPLSKFFLLDTTSIETINPEFWDFEVAYRSNPKTFNDRAVTYSFTKEMVKKAMVDYISNSGIFLKSDLILYKRKVGIFQGFPLSATLCNIFYNQLVDKFLSFTFDRSAPSTLLRLADDFLFISTSKELCEEMYGVVNGDDFKSHGAFINEEKTQWYTSGSMIKFCGLDIDSSDLSIKTKTIYNPRYLALEKCHTPKELYTFMLWWYKNQLKAHVVSTEYDTFINQVSNLEKIWKMLTTVMISIMNQFTSQGLLVPVEAHSEFLLHICEITLQKWNQYNDQTWSNQILTILKRYLRIQGNIDDKALRACSVLDLV